MTVQPNDRRDVYRAAEDEAARRHVVKQRAVELKRALLESTLRLSPERAAAAYNQAARKARSAQQRSIPFLKLCVAVLSGAMSMLVPIPSTSTLHGELTMAEPSQLAATHDTTGARRALVHAHPSQCARLSIDEPAAIFVDLDNAEPARLEGLVTRLALRAGIGDAACQIELQLLNKHAPSQAVAELPAQATLTAVVPMQASSWLDVMLDRAAREEGVQQASIALRNLGESAGQRSVALVEHLRGSSDVRQQLESLRQIFASEEQ
jgi:hypothetical protein